MKISLSFVAGFWNELYFLWSELYFPWANFIWIIQLYQRHCYYFL